jgi:general secretion pathway protein L
MGHKGWIAAARTAHLNICLNAFKDDNRLIDSVVPLFEPFDDFDFSVQCEPDLGQDTKHPIHIYAERAWDAHWMLVAVTSEGVLSLPSTAPMVQAWLEDASVVWSAEPDIADAVSQWVGQEVMPVAKVQRMWLAAQDGSNLLQFEMAVSSKGVRRYKQWLSQLKAQSWRPIYVGLAFLVLAHAMGLQFYVWSISRLVRHKQDEIHAITQQTFPSIQVVLDAPKQMQNELDLRKNQQGEAGSHDFETLLNEVSSVWPTGKPWATQVDYESGELTLSISYWSEEEFQQFKSLPLFNRWDVQFQKESNILKLKKNG